MATTKTRPRRHTCDGNPSLTNYGRGCRCDLCRSVKSLYERDRRSKANKEKSETKHGPRREKKAPLQDAYTREEILEARAQHEPV